MDHNTFLASDLAVKILLLLTSSCNTVRQAGLFRDNWSRIFFFLFFLLFKCNSVMVSQTHSNITTLNERQFLKYMCYFLPVLRQEGETGLKKHVASHLCCTEMETWPHASTLHSQLRPKGLYLFFFFWLHLEMAMQVKNLLRICWSWWSLHSYHRVLFRRWATVLASRGNLFRTAIF